MQQLLKCAQCGNLRFVDLGLPVDLCDRCLRAIRGRVPSRLDLAEVLALAAEVRETSGLTWEEALDVAVREVELED